MKKQSCTIYNKYWLAGVEKYQRTVLKGIYWQQSEGRQVSDQQLVRTCKFKVFIPCTAKAGGEYVSPKAWQGLALPAGFWTLAMGDKIVLGEVNYEIVETAGELEQMFDQVCTITTLNYMNQPGRLAHWQVG